MNKTTRKTILHGTAVLLKEGRFKPSAVFIRGSSGSGKSDLAFRLVEAGASLVSDDQVALEKQQDKLIAGTMDAIAGLLEVRGVGLLHYPAAEHVRVRLVIDLVSRENVPRLPEWEEVDILGVRLPRLKLHAFEASAPLKIIKAMEAVHAPEMVVK
jgi:serine kinase of HPr protein (carbohydrate metabolism regulator)